jgi:hypothetical protein
MKWFLRCLAAVVGFTALAFALAWITMLLWNWLIVGLFGGPIIDYWQAAGLMILGRLLVGGFKGGRGHCGHHGWGHRSGYWKRRWEDKMANMTPEEKEKFKMGMNKCGGWGRWDDCETESPKAE